MDLLQPEDEDIWTSIRKWQAQNSVAKGDIAEDGNSLLLITSQTKLIRMIKTMTTDPSVLALAPIRIDYNGSCLINVLCFVI